MQHLPLAGACCQAASNNFEFVLPLATVVVGVVPPSSQQYSVDLSAVPWLRLDTLNHRCDIPNCAVPCGAKP